MDALEREREYLDEADSHIAAAKRQVEKQKRVIEKSWFKTDTTRKSPRRCSMLWSAASTHSRTIAK
jgi:hypothetical protein